MVKQRSPRPDRALGEQLPEVIYTLLSGGVKTLIGAHVGGLRGEDGRGVVDHWCKGFGCGLEI